jgi:hypothetical protein
MAGTRVLLAIDSASWATVGEIMLLAIGPVNCAIVGESVLLAIDSASWASMGEIVSVRAGPAASWGMAGTRVLLAIDSASCANIGETTPLTAAPETNCATVAEGAPSRMTPAMVGTRIGPAASCFLSTAASSQELEPPVR